jgi:hypothetical protein
MLEPGKVDLRTMKRSRVVCSGISLIALQLSLCGSLHSQEVPDVIAWTFDEQMGSLVHDSAGNKDDRVDGFWSRVPGVHGQALEFDDYSTRIVRAAKDVPALGQAFSLSAWVALNNYPWNWVPLLDQSAANQIGYFFGIDAFGHVGFDVSVDGVWQQLVSTKSLPLKKWMYLTASFDANSGMTIYINGEAEASLRTTGAFAQAKNADLYVGRVRTPQIPFPSWAVNPREPVKYSLDGDLDEVRISNRQVSSDEAKAVFMKTNGPGAAAVLPYAVLPSGPAGAGPFGAFYASLEFTRTWDRPRRFGPDSDVVVRFEHSPVRLLFWQGTNFIPAWVTENGKWYTDEFLEAWGPQCVEAGDCEPMSDKQSRYSRVSILESNPARAVIHWRYGLPEVRNYKGANADPETGWFDWADEYWYVYPDGVALRKQILWSSDLDPKPPAGHEWQETIVINGPGQKPEDNIEPDALTLVNMRGETHTYHWDPKTDESFDYPKGPSTLNLPEGANIQIVNLKSTEKPFEVVWPRGTHFDSYTTGGKSYSMFGWWNHWPVAQIASSGRPAVAADRASHSSLSHIYWDAYQKDDQTETKLLLSGLTSLPPTQLLPLARSWISPPAITVTQGDAISAEYDESQRAFVVHRSARAKSGNLTLRISASEASPLVNPAFLIENWSAPATVTVGSKGAKTSGSVRSGYAHHLGGDSLVLFVTLTSNAETEIKVDEAAK